MAATRLQLFNGPSLHRFSEQQLATTSASDDEILSRRLIWPWPRFAIGILFTGLELLKAKPVIRVNSDCLNQSTNCSPERLAFSASLASSFSGQWFGARRGADSQQPVSALPVFRCCEVA